MNHGYVPFSREHLHNGMLRNHKLWAFWSWCLLKASYKNHSQVVGNQIINLGPGQFIFGRKKASEELGLTETSLRTIIKNLEKSQNLTIKTTNKFSIITIVNWDSYEAGNWENNQQINQQLTNNQPTTNQQLTTNNKGNKGNKGKNGEGEYRGEITHREQTQAFDGQRLPAVLTENQLGDNDGIHDSDARADEIKDHGPGKTAGCGEVQDGNPGGYPVSGISGRFGEGAEDFGVDEGDRVKRKSNEWPERFTQVRREIYPEPGKTMLGEGSEDLGARKGRSEDVGQLSGHGRQVEFLPGGAEEGQSQQRRIVGAERISDGIEDERNGEGGGGRKRTGPNERSLPNGSGAAEGVSGRVSRIKDGQEGADRCGCSILPGECAPERGVGRCQEENREISRDEHKSSQEQKNKPGRLDSDYLTANHPTLHADMKSSNVGGKSTRKKPSIYISRDDIKQEDLPAGLTVDLVGEFIDYRKSEKKNPLTPRAYKSALKSFKMSADDNRIPIEWVVRYTMDIKQWLTAQPSWIAREIDNIRRHYDVNEQPASSIMTPEEAKASLARWRKMIDEREKENDVQKATTYAYEPYAGTNNREAGAAIARETLSRLFNQAR